MDMVLACKKLSLRFILRSGDDAAEEEEEEEAADVRGMLVSSAAASNASTSPMLSRSSRSRILLKRLLGLEKRPRNTKTPRAVVA